METTSRENKEGAKTYMLFTSSGIMVLSNTLQVCSSVCSVAYIH